MKILVTSCQNALKIPSRKVQRLVKAFLDWKRVDTQELSVHFVDKRSIGHLHKKYFQDPTPTDCISFPIDCPGKDRSGYSILGEIFVCPEIAIDYVQKEGGDPYREISLYIIHGLLHLLGYDDQDLKNRSLMFAEQTSAMLYLEKNGSLLHK